jgi:hypothetical protein
MIIQWTPSGGSAVYLGDDLGANTGGVKVALKLERLGAAGLEQVVPLFQGANPFRQMLGNVCGDCIFTAARSHADRASAAAFFKGEAARVGQKGNLVLTIDSASLTMANATLRSVAAIAFDGTRWTLRYGFGITTIT